MLPPKYLYCGYLTVGPLLLNLTISVCLIESANPYGYGAIVFNKYYKCCTNTHFLKL